MKKPSTSVTPEYTTGRSQLESDDEVRLRCRNPRCRSKLPAPVSNPREAFCTRGCHDSFYRHRCLICERPIEQPKRGKRVICKKAVCRKALRSNSYHGRYPYIVRCKINLKQGRFYWPKRATQTRPTLAYRRWPGIECLSVPLRRGGRRGSSRGNQPEQFQTLARRECQGRAKDPDRTPPSSG